MPDLLVRAQELGGRWVSLGADSARGIVVENLTHDADDWGPRSCSFTLRRRTDVPWPDIGALAPVEIFEQGLPVWSGRVKGTPTTDDTDRRISVNGEGWQYHLDDDSFQKVYVDSKLANWVDSKTKPTATLSAGAFCAGGQVVNGDAGGIVLSFPINGVRAINDVTGVQYDAGPSSLINDISFTLRSSNNGAGNFICRAYYSLDGLTYVNIFSKFLDAALGAPPITIGAGPINFDLTGLIAAPGARYFAIQLQSLAAGAAAADIFVQIQSCNTYAATSYASSGTSILKAGAVVQDAIVRGTLLLSSDLSKLVATSFNIPDYAMTGPGTPREVINAVNTYHGYQARIGVDKAPEYRPRPSLATIQVDARSTFDEASSGDSSEIYSGVIVNYIGPDGTPAQVARSQPASLYALSTIQLTNPGAEVNTANWSAPFVGVLSRTTVAGEFTAGVAGFKVAVPGSGSSRATSSVWSGSFVAGNSYRLALDLRGDAGILAAANISLDGGALAVAVTTGSGVFQGVTMDWVQPSTVAPALNVDCTGFFAAYNFYFDNILLYEAAATIVNRRGFRRTKVLDTNMALTPAAAQQIGDAFLASHRTTPLKGKLVVTGYGLASNARTGQRMRASELTLCVGELVRFAHLIDPDTGAIGREGRIASASYDADSDTCTLEIDSMSTNFESMVSRLSVLTGQVPG